MSLSVSATNSATPSGVQFPLAPYVAASATTDPAAAASATTGNADQPAVIVSISAAASAQASSTASLPSLNAAQVSQALYDVSGSNGFADLYAHANWTRVAAKFGTAIEERDRLSLLTVLTNAAQLANTASTGAGFQVEKSSSDLTPDSEGNSPDILSVSGFSFNDNGSTYSITKGKDGTLVGTKDGQAWQTWQILFRDQISSASLALQTLQTGAGNTVAAGTDTIA